VFLAPLAERHRRFLVISIGLGGLFLQSLFAWTPLQSLGRALVAPVAALTMPLAGLVVDQVDPGSGMAEPDQLQQANAKAWILAERQGGRPLSIPGVAWVEIPVFQVLREQNRLLLVAGQNYGLAPGMAVVFGDTWLGRISKVSQTWAEVELWTAAAVPTAAQVLGQNEAMLLAIAEGRGRTIEPILRWVEAASDPLSNAEVQWRATAEDMPGLKSIRLKLGIARLAGDIARGSSFWQIETRFPPGSEGRVFVAAGAVAESTIAEPRVMQSAARLALRGDGVLGAGLVGVRVLDPIGASVILVQDQVLGRVVAQRGDLYWCNRIAASAWGDQAIRMGLSGNFDPQGDLFYTRGDGQIPRGLWLGKNGAVPVKPQVKLRALARVPLSEREDQS
jgi:rod shape-determining protein MreC